MNLSDSIVYSNQTHLVYRGYEDGEVMETSGIDARVRILEKLPGEDLLVGFQGENLSVFSLEGEKLDSFKVGNTRPMIEFTSFDSDGNKEIVVAEGRKAKILDINRSSETIALNQSLEETVFAGTGNAMLKAVALNQTSFVTDNFSQVEKTVNRTVLNVTGVGEISGVKSIEQVNRAFNLSREKYYVEDRKKAVYISILAAENNASLTFEKSEADRDFSNYSVTDLRNMVIEERKPNHVVVADLDSSSGILASYMALRQNALPIDSDDNNVILGERIDKVFEKIGENRNTVLKGKYIYSGWS